MHFGVDAVGRKFQTDEEGGRERERIRDMVFLYKNSFHMLWFRFSVSIQLIVIVVNLYKKTVASRTSDWLTRPRPVKPAHAVVQASLHFSARTKHSHLFLQL